MMCDDGGRRIPMKKVRAAVIGLGAWGQCHLEAYRSLPQVEVAAVCDANADRLRLAEEYGVPGRYTSIDALLERDDIDLVSVVTFEKDHLQPTLKALRAGKHVLVEKPVSTELAEAKEMWRVAQEHNRKLYPGHILRFDPKYAEVYNSIQNGKIGQPVSMYLKRSRPKSLFATFHRMHTVFLLMVHDLDMAIWYAGSRVKSVRAYSRHLSDKASPEVLWSVLQFENGVTAVLQSNWMSPDEAGVETADSVEVIGVNGIAQYETSFSGLQIWNQAGRTTPEFNIHRKANGHVYGALRDQLGFLSDCIRNGEGDAYVSFPDAIHGIEVAEAILESTRTGKEIVLEP